MSCAKRGMGNRGRNGNVETTGEAKLTQLSIELERLAGELVKLGGDASPPKAIDDEGQLASDRLRHRLLAARKARGLRQTDVAGRLDRPQSFVSNYERGVRRLEVSEFIAIAKVLGLDAAAVVAELAG